MLLIGIGHLRREPPMAIASRILGDEVGSTAPAFLAFLAVHVIAGLTAVITGGAAALARKGSPRHIRPAAGTTGPSPPCSPPPPRWPRCAGLRTGTCSSSARWRSSPPRPGT